MKNVLKYSVNRSAGFRCVDYCGISSKPCTHYSIDMLCTIVYCIQNNDVVYNVYTPI